MAERVSQPVIILHRKCHRSALLLSASTSDLRLIAQADRSDAGCDIETGVPLETDRLQRNRAVGAADEHIGAGADPNRGASARTNIIARQRYRGEAAARREDAPDQHAALRIANVHTEFVDRAGIVLRPASRPRKGAADRLRRGEHKPPT